MSDASERPEADASDRCAEVAVPVPLRRLFHYRVGPDLAERLTSGHRIIVPFGGRRVIGIFSRFVDPPEDRHLRRVERLLDEEPAIAPDVLELATFVAEYYLAPIGEVLKAALPPALSKLPEDRWVLTPSGRQAHEDYQRDRLTSIVLSPADRQLLSRLKRSDGLPAKRLPAGTRRRLADEGLIRLREGGLEDDDRVVWVERSASPEEAFDRLRRAPRRRAVYEALAVGPRREEDLVAWFGRRPVADAVGRLERDGLVRRTRRALRPAVELPAWSAPTLTCDQQPAVDRLDRAIADGREETVLLQGVTGSGKTEVYLHAIRQSLLQGRGSIVLVPEIGLTPQLEARFRARFGDHVVTLHSGLAPAERRRRFRQLRRGDARVALGPRSAVWAPVTDLGLIVVDEEHDPSYKQGSDVRYHGRDVALVRGQQAKAVTVLGSATPSLEAYELVERKRVERLQLRERATGAGLPQISIVDLCSIPTELRLVTPPLRDALTDAVRRNEQAILFLNRRGFNTAVLCGDCRQPRRCPHCDVSFTLHVPLSRLRCHHCGKSERLESPCPSCGAIDPIPLGAGTQRAFEEIQQLVPETRLGRLDRDSATTAGQVREILAKFRTGEIQVLVGTQMVTKGHDFPNVTLVGILQADASLAFPDFRATEHTFQLLTQVAGRAGRAEKPGQVIIQTFQPEHPVFEFARSQDPDGFFAFEAPQRKQVGFPPYGRVGLVRCESEDDDAARAWMAHMARAIERQAQGRDTRTLGPTEAPLSRLQGRFRHRLMVLAPSPARLVQVMSAAAALRETAPSSVHVILDVDAYDFL